MLIRGMLSLDVPRGRQINMLHSVLPIKVDATKQAALPVHCDFIMVLQIICYVPGVLDAFALHTRIIHNEAEHDGPPDVFV